MTTRLNTKTRSLLTLTLTAVASLLSTTETVQAQPALLPPINIAAWKQSAEYRAMQLERELAVDMPQNQCLMLGSHNSFNSGAYPAGYIFFQHTYTLSQQLDLGLRALDIDIHHLPLYPNELFVTHSLCNGSGYNPGEKTLTDILIEIRDWMNDNPDEVVVLNLEQHFQNAYANDPTQHNRCLIIFESILGNISGNDRLIRPSEITDSSFVTTSLATLRALGRVIVFNIGGAGGVCEDDSHFIPDYPAQNVMFPNQPPLATCGSGRYLYVRAMAFANDPEQHYWGSSPRGGLKTDNCDKSIFSFLYNNTSTIEYQEYGSEPPSVVREAIRSGMDVIRFDPVGSSRAATGQVIQFPADEQMRATIWSWDYRYLPFADGTPLAAMAVIQGDTARIRYEYPDATMRYALQSETGEWSISSQSGTFAEAPPIFRVPGNGFEMQNLFGHMVRAGITKVWVNYHDLDGDGNWTPTTQQRYFSSWNAQPPIISPVPSLVTNGSELAARLIDWRINAPPPTGRVLGVLPGSYPTGSTVFRFSSACTIVPAEHGQPVAIGRP